MSIQEQITNLIQAALHAVDPAQAVRQAVQREQNHLIVDGALAGFFSQERQDDIHPHRTRFKRYDLDKYERIFVIGGGKAGAPMAQALGEILGEYLTAGWINVKQGHLVDRPLPAQITLQEAGHPIPDQAGRHGAQQIRDVAQQASAHDLVFCLISGGGSALLPLPVQGISLADLQALTSVLLRCGATINEINAVRKHCSQIKGGQLARAAHPATTVSLLLSDVVGNPLDVIASGPTVPDTTTFGDAYAILRKYEIVEAIPPSILAHLQAGLEGQVSETPKPGDPIFASVQNVIIGSNAIAASSARAKAQEMGFHTLVLSTYIEGEARQVGRVMAGIAKSLIVEGWPIARPGCVIAGGETTVTIHGSGKGGRNQEMALSAALALEGWEGIYLVTLATDGTDGPTDAAGAIVTGDTVSRARSQGMSAADFLARNDSYTFFDRLGDLIRTGPTNTNVNDLVFILAP